MFAAVIAAIVMVPPYFEARARCDQLQEAARDRSDAPSPVDPRPGRFTIQPDPDVTRYIVECGGLAH